MNVVNVMGIAKGYYDDILYVETDRATVEVEVWKGLRDKAQDFVGKLVAVKAYINEAQAVIAEKISVVTKEGD